MEKERLIGEDGKLVRVTPGVEKVGDAVKTFDVHMGGTAGAGKGWWKITAIAATGSIFTTGVTGTFRVGDLFKADGSEVMATGDKAALVTITDLSDISSFETSFQRDKVEVTVLADGVKKYRYGKADVSGTIEGAMIVGVTDQDEGMISRFMRRIKYPNTGNVVISEVDNGPIYIMGIIQKDEATSGERHQFAFMQIELEGYKMGAKSGERQAWSSGFSCIGDDPVFYDVENA